MIRLDIGCGKNKKPGFLGVDQYAFEGVDVVCNVAKDIWPWDHGTVEEVHCSHFLEHLTAKERIRFFNELYRVMAVGAKATIITPHWCSNRAYGDLTHQWPPVSEMFWYYVDAGWRKSQAPHTDKEFNADGFECDFAATWGYGLHPQITPRNPESQQFAMTFYKEAAQDMHCTLVKK
mgnify:CR=1 FL=1